METETLYRQLISNSLKLQQHIQFLITQQVLLLLVTTLISQRYNHTVDWATYYGQVYSYDLNKFEYQLIAQVDKVLAVDNLLLYGEE